MSLIWGHAWHGEWRPAGLKLPNDDVKTIAWSPEGGSSACPDWSLDSSTQEMWPSYGDCIDIKIPDRPAVTTPESDVSAGREWLNYALICGATHSMCGVRIGRNRLIYIDPNGGRWLVTLADMENGSHWIDAEFKRFGKFLSSSETVSFGFYVTAAFGEDAPVFFMDASRTGSKITIGCRLNSSNAIVYLLAGTFSGIPGSTLAWTVRSDIFELDDTVLDTVSPPGRSSGLLHSLTNQSGFIYDGETVLAASVGYDFSVSATELVSGYYTPTTIDGDLVVKIGSSEFTIPLTIVQSWPVANNHDTCDIEVTAFGDTYSYSGSRGTVGGNPYWKLDIPIVSFVRRSNRVLEAIVYWSAVPDTSITWGYSTTSGPGVARSICLCLPDRFEETDIDIPTNGSDDRYFSYHPVTGGLLSDTSPICWM